MAASCAGEREGAGLTAFMAAPNDDFFVAATEAESFSAAAAATATGAGAGGKAIGVGKDLASIAHDALLIDNFTDSMGSE